MTNKQAIHLRPGHRIRRRDDPAGTIYVVERVERKPVRGGVDSYIYAGGQVFMAWEIERYETMRGWPAPKSDA